MKIKLLCILYFIFLSVSIVKPQTSYSPDLRTVLNGKNWNGKFISAEIVKKDSSNAILITKTEGDQLVWLKDFTFKNGIIEFDAKGKSGPPQSSFIGVAFNVVNNETYDAVYFRPFNFRSANPVNKSHAVQYTSHPNWTWDRLRNEHPGEYEKGIDPSPDGDEWFHARIVINKPKVKVYVNGADSPSLEVNELSDRIGGSVGIWCNGFGEIANLKINKSLMNEDTLNVFKAAGKYKAGFYLITAEADNRSALPAADIGQQILYYDYKFLQVTERGEPRYLLLPKTADVQLMLVKAPELQKGENGFPELRLELTPEAAGKLEKLTREHLGSKVVFMIDGEPVTIHKIRSVITGGQFRITRCTDTACQYIYGRLVEEK